MSSHATPIRPAPERRNAIVRLFSSIWFGITILVLILIYSSIVSALPPVRWTLEVTEMQAFRHWFFVTLVILFTLSLLAATFLRTRWTGLNAGALMAHLGLLLLVGGALAYFGTKIEGDVRLEAPAIVVRATLGGQTGTIGHFPASPGAAWSRLLPNPNTPLRLQVLDARPRTRQTGATASVSVQLGDAAPRTLQLSDTPTDRQAACENVDLYLVSSPPETCFYEDETPVLYFRNSADGTEIARRISHLPIHRDRYLTDEGLLRDTRGAEVPSKRTRPEICLLGLNIPTGWFESWRMPIDVDTEGLPFTVRVTGYVPCVADLRPKMTPEGRPGFEPILEPRDSRRGGMAPRATSAIRLKITGRGAQANWSESQWCLFSSYPTENARRTRIQVPGTDTIWDVVYSRARHELGAAVTARRVSATFFPGQRGVESYRSDITVQADDNPPQPATVSTNQTLTIGRWTLFQSGFDFEEYWRYTVLGVGNRIGTWPMNIGWILVTLGCLYAFYIKPVLLRRAKTSTPAKAMRQGVTAILLCGLLLNLPGCRKPAEPYPPSATAAQLDGQINWTDARLIVAQEGGRYKTLDALAREAFSAMTGKEHLPGLSPTASLLEWVFNSQAYMDTPCIRVKEIGLCDRLTAHMPPEQRQRILAGKLFTPRELADSTVQRTLSSLQAQPLSRKAANRVREAEHYAGRLSEDVAVVPQPGGDRVAPWFTPAEVLGSLSDEQLTQLGLTRDAFPPEAQHPIHGLTPDQALAITVAWTSLRAAWLSGDAASVQTYLARLGELLPPLATPGIYPTVSQRAAEVRYYAMGKFTIGWLVYFLAFLVSIWALVTRWRFPWVLTMILLVIGLAWHGYGLGLRWYILGRIPVANMFEAVEASAWLGIAAALLVELVVKTRILLVGASALGFFFLVIAGYVLPGGELSTIPGILDHLQLRIHTVLISFSYALIFLAAIVALVYLIGYYSVRARQHGRYSTATANNLPGSVSRQRPLMAGASPGDEAQGANLPQWLNDMDWSHLIIINLVFVMLFVGGVIMGAIWANESWGRPWGWDPKEVFALNTWIIYAILIHLRFVVRNRGLWTAWLSIAGCAMMAFNWFFVNFFINSVHSYA